MKKSSVPPCLLLIFLSLIFEEATSFLCTVNPDTINLPQGTIRGSFDLFNNQRKFMGIPYASVIERFEDPGSPPSWNGTFTANRGNIMCNQYISALNTPAGQEDCLVLNVFTPTCLEQTPLPVMVFVHGGGYYSGSNSDLIYNPKYLVQQKVIVVTINYRLGAFGFLCLRRQGAPGNVGLKDQLAALKWIQNNIAYFGGDRNEVTIFGESAGAVSVHFLLLTLAGSGLFHKAILQSGSVLMPQDFSYQPVESASVVASRLGYNTSDPEELVKIFKNSTANDIVKASNVDQTNNAFGPYFFAPCVETALPNRKPVITEPPTQLINKSGLNVPIIIGFNDREGIYWAQHYVSQTREQLKANFDRIIPSYLQFQQDSDKAAFIDDAFNFYFNNGTAIDNLIEYFSDSLVAFPIILSSKSILQDSTRTLHYYDFEYDSFRNLNKMMTKLPTKPGACHADELFYLFQPIVYSILPPTSNDATVINTMTTLWTSFAKTGTPLNSNSIWRRSNLNQLEFLEINKETRMISLPNKDRMEFWRQKYETYGRK